MQQSPARNVLAAGRPGERAARAGRERDRCEQRVGGRPKTVFSARARVCARGRRVTGCPRRRRVNLTATPYRLSLRVRYIPRAREFRENRFPRLFAIIFKGGLYYFTVEKPPRCPRVPFNK